jgi:hypothetical protein
MPSHCRMVIGVLVGSIILLTAARASAQTVTNPNFDTGITGWAPSGSGAFDPAVDVNGSPTSGSARGSTALPAGASTSFFQQCVTGVSPGTEYSFGTSVLTTPASGISGYVGTVFYSDAACSTPVGVGGNSSAASGSGWQTSSGTAIAPAGAVAVLLALNVTSTSGGDLTIHFDNVTLQSVPPVPTLSRSWLWVLAIGSVFAVLYRRRLRSA